MPFTTQTHDVSTGALPRWLGPLSVGGKLSLGFGLVLSCSLAMALTAMHAVRATQSDAQQLRSLDRLQGRLAQARLEEKDFGLRASPAAAEQVEDSLRRLLAELPGAHRAPACAMHWKPMLQSSWKPFESMPAHGAKRSRRVCACRRRRKVPGSVSVGCFSIS